MIDFIQSETKKLMFNCCKRHSDEKKIELENVQLILGLDVDGNTYTICENYQPKLSLDIMGVLGVRVDFLGYSRLAPPFILKSLVRFSEVHNIPIQDSKVMCVPTKNEKGKPDVLLFIYNGNNYVETITFEDLFREEDFEIPKEM
jgi:hypothetical protein